MHCGAAKVIPLTYTQAPDSSCSHGHAHKGTCDHASLLAESNHRQLNFGPVPTRARMLLGWSDMRQAERGLLRHTVLPLASTRLAKRPMLWAACKSLLRRSALQPACQTQSVSQSVVPVTYVVSTCDPKISGMQQGPSVSDHFPGRLSWRVPNPSPTVLDKGEAITFTLPQCTSQPCACKHHEQVEDAMPLMRFYVVTAVLPCSLCR